MTQTQTAPDVHRPDGDNIEYVRVQRLCRTARRCDVGFGRSRCRRRQVYWLKFKSWAGGFGSARVCDDHLPAGLQLTHREGGIEIAADVRLTAQKGE